jgi:hypothetical protein
VPRAHLLNDCRSMVLQHVRERPQNMQPLTTTHPLATPPPPFIETCFMLRTHSARTPRDTSPSKHYATHLTPRIDSPHLRECLHKLVCSATRATQPSNHSRTCVQKPAGMPVFQTPPRLRGACTQTQHWTCDWSPSNLRERRIIGLIPKKDICCLFQLPEQEEMGRKVFL